MTLEAQDQYFKIWAIQTSSLVQQVLLRRIVTPEWMFWFGVIIPSPLLVWMYHLFPWNLFSIHKKFARDRETAWQLAYRRWAHYPTFKSMKHFNLTGSFACTRKMHSEESVKFCNAGKLFLSHSLTNGRRSAGALQTDGLCSYRAHRQQHISYFPNFPLGTIPSFWQGALPKRHERLTGVSAIAVLSRVHVPTPQSMLSQAAHTQAFKLVSSVAPSGSLNSVMKGSHLEFVSHA